MVRVLTGVRKRWVAAACAFLVAVAVMFTGARAWATAHSPAHCRPAAAPSTPAVGPPTTHGTDNSWRVHALRAAGCGAWHRMRQHMHHKG